MAVAANPWDADSREWITDLASFALLEVEFKDPLAEARGSIVVAFLDELETEPQLLVAYAEAVGGDDDDDITLAIDAAEVDESAAVARIQHVLVSAGLDLTTVPDAVLVARSDRNAKRPTKAVKVDLERRADALLTRRPARLGVPAYDPERVGELKARLAARARG